MRCSVWIRRASNAARGLQPRRHRASPDVTGRRDGGGLPWTTRPSVDHAPPSSPTARIAVPDVLPSRLVARPTSRSSGSTTDDLRLIGGWLERPSARWPRRRSLRREAHRHGKRIDLRATMRASRTTGWEIVRLARTRRRRPAAPRRTGLRRQQIDAALRDDLSASDAGGGVAPNGIRPEVFAFSTSLTRLTPVLSHRSAEVALARANAQGRRPVRRHAPGPQPRRAAGRAARQHAARCRGDHRLRRLGQRPAGGARAGDGPAASSGRTWWSGSIRGPHSPDSTAGRVDGRRAAVLRSVSARAFAVGIARPVRRVGWPGYSSTGATSPAERRRSNSARPTEMMPGRIDRNTISRIMNSRLCLTNGTLPRK